MTNRHTIYALFLILFIGNVGCKKSAETEGIQALCPIVISTDPMLHAVDIDYDKIITIQFNTEMDSNSINSSSFLIQDAASTAILTGKIEATENPSIYRFKPDLPLLHYNQYKLTVKKTATNRYRLAMVSDYRSDFTTTPSLTLFPSSKESGIVVGAGNYAQGSNVAISAFHSTGYVFINWTETGTSHIISTSPNYLYPLNGNHSLTANFIPVVLGKFSVNLRSNPLFGGITIGSGAYDAGSPVLIQATANSNFSFANWTKNGQLISLDPSFQIESLTSNSIYVANFNANPLSQNSLTVSSNPITGGTATGGGTYHAGASVTIKASPFTGHRFINWTDQYTGSIVSSSSNYTFVLNTNKSLVANYSINQYTITTTAVNGSITKNPDQLDYNHGSSLQLTAVPKAGYSFTSWSGDTIATSNPLTIKILSNKKMTANFTAIPAATYTINITSNNGTVTKSPNTPSYTSGTNVQLTASPIAGYLFSSWSGDTIATSNPINIKVNKNKNFTANFTIIPIVSYTLNTIGINGAIALNPSQLTYNSGASVELTATPNAGYTFSSWTGDTTATSNPLIIGMNANKNITGNFTAIPPATFTLNITSNNGTVTKSPNIIAFEDGATVKITATPSVGYTFTSWSGDTIATTNPLSLVMSSNKNITANFTAIPIVTYTLTTNATNGTVTKNPNQTNYNTGSTVQLTATPAEGYTFSSWSGDATGSANPLSVAMSANKNITANFTIIPIVTYTLTTTATNGTVAKSPNQVNYTSGTSVQLTATAAADYRFGSWTGDATGSTNPLSVNMDTDKTIAANFIAIVPPVVLGSIANFGAYGGSAGITNQGVETVVHNGAIGTTAAATLITGFHDGKTGTPYTETPLNIGNIEDGIFTAPPAPGTTASFTTATNALSDANTAYLSISPASKPGGTDPGAGELGGLTLTPGIYKSSIATYKITNEDLILDAQGDPYAYWIFQMTAGLTVGGPGGARNVILRGGAQAKNVFWYVGSAAVINYAGGGTMVGTIIATAGVTLSSPASSTKLSPLTVLNGRAISLVASVTMVNTVINNQ
jgi:hypothetical protein